jgi:TatD DNase family protein
VGARLVDTHAHIQEPDFRDDVDAVIVRAGEAGVGAIIVPGVDAETSEAAAWLADRHPAVYFAAGFHPHEAARMDSASLARVRSLLSHPKAVAVGEVGLDFYRMHSPRQAQERTLEAMLDLARETRLPVIVHTRDAAQEVERALRSWALRNRPAYEGRPLGVLHYYSGDLAQARRYLAMGFLISVHTSVTHPRATLLREVVKDLPLEALVLETDSPYGAPQAVRGARNEPAYVVEAAKRVAQLKGLRLDEVAQATSANAERLFGITMARNRMLTGAQS